MNRNQGGRKTRKVENPVTLVSCFRTRGKWRHLQDPTTGNRWAFRGYGRTCTWNRLSFTAASRCLLHLSDKKRMTTDFCREEKDPQLYSKRPCTHTQTSPSVCYTTIAHSPLNKRMVSYMRHLPHQRRKQQGHKRELNTERNRK